jgi:hypothetical protein
VNKNWHNFERTFEIRNDIVHKMKEANLATPQMVSICDNALNVMEAASFVVMLSEMDEIVRIMKSKKTVREEIREVFGQYRRKLT